MFQRLQRSRRLRRAKPGDDRALTDLRWWQALTRTQFFLDPDESVGRTARYAVDVHYLAADLEGGTLAEGRSEEHTSELQSRFDLVCRLLLEKITRITY